MAGDEKEQLKTLVEGVVLAQGNEYIKDLLRRKHLPIGTTKADFVDHLRAAIDADQLTAADIEQWLHEVEGWGNNQHVYLYRLPRELAASPLWADATAIQELVTEAGYGDVWDAETSHAFPEALTLTGIHYLQSPEERRLRFEWHQGVETLVRVPQKDFDEVEEDEQYHYKAYAKRRQRIVVRFEVRPQLRLAAAFVQVPTTSKEHDSTVVEMWKVVSAVAAQSKFTEFNLAKAIRKIDEDVTPGPLRTNRVRLVTPGAFVTYGATATTAAYRDVQDANDARKAVSTIAAFTGGTSNVLYSASTSATKDKDVQVRLDGPNRRIWIRAQLTEAQVWSLLTRVASYA